MDILKKYAALLVHYCLDLKASERLYVSSTTLAEPLIREIYRFATRAGALMEVDLAFEGKETIFLQEAKDQQLDYIPMVYCKAVNEFDAYLAIRAPFEITEKQEIPADNASRRRAAEAPFQQKYFERIADNSLKRSLCQYPTKAAAKKAGMSLKKYEEFVYGACKLFDENPNESWLKVREFQQKIVDKLHTCDKIHYKGDGIDLTFSTKGRTWINSDGRNNMPSGEVFTAPVEDSVQGVVHFSFPAIYGDGEAEGVTLWVKNGYIERWEAKKGKIFLDRIFAIAGTRRFGEAAIGTNYDIQRMTKNILFDEKIGGTVHLAVGQAYLQCGGKNQSSVHWDMITDMRNGGEIFANDEKIYDSGRFLFL